MPIKSPKAKARAKEKAKARLAKDRLENPEKYKLRKAEWYLKNKERIAVKMKDDKERKRLEDPSFKIKVSPKVREKKKAYLKVYYTENKEVISERGKEYRSENRERIAEVSRSRYEENKGVTNPKRYLKSSQERLLVLTHYSGGEPFCSLCGEREYRTLHLDHINGDGASHRREVTGKNSLSTVRWVIKNDFPVDMFRVLCANCNFKEHLRLNRESHTQAPLSIKTRANIQKRKESFMSLLGGKCAICGNSDMEVLTVHHINNDGAEHRKRVSGGKGGETFYAAVRKSGNYSGLECRCFNCNVKEFEFSSPQIPSQIPKEPISGID